MPLLHVNRSNQRVHIPVVSAVIKVHFLTGKKILNSLNIPLLRLW